MRRKPSEKFIAALPLLVWLLCVLQPVLDVAAYWMRELSLSSTWTTAVRLLLLLGSFVVGFAASAHRKAYVVFSLAVLACLVGHVLACLQVPGGYLNWSEDLTDQARTLVLPITVLSLLSCMRASTRVFPAVLRAMAVNLGVIFAVMLVSTLTGTDPHTYPTKSAGIRGWFIWPSPQSAILSILCPLVIGWAYTRWPDRLLPVLLASLFSFGMLYFYGTRLGYLTVAGVGLFLAACVALRGKRHRLQAAAIFLSALLLLAFYPLSPMAVNRAAVEENEAIKQSRVSAAAAEAARTEPGSVSEQTPKSLAALRAAYRYNLQGMVDRFGLERVAERYGYTLDSGVICNDRIMKTRFCSLLVEELSSDTPLARLFGVELSRTRVENTEVYEFYADAWELGTENYDPENDVYGVLTFNGVIGFCLLAGFLLWLLLRAFLAACRERWRFTPLFAAFLSAAGIGVIYAVGTASTLRRNNASFYFALALAGLSYLATRPRLEGESYDSDQHHHSGL